MRVSLEIYIFFVFSKLSAFEVRYENQIKKMPLFYKTTAGVPRTSGLCSCRSGFTKDSREHIVGILYTFDSLSSGFPRWDNILVYTKHNIYDRIRIRGNYTVYAIVQHSMISRNPVVVPVVTKYNEKNAVTRADEKSIGFFFFAVVLSETQLRVILLSFVFRHANPIS